jgi:hypothetical protein
MSYDMRDPEQRAIAMDRRAARVQPTVGPAHAIRRRRAERASTYSSSTTPSLIFFPEQLTCQRHDARDEVAGVQRTVHQVRIEGTGATKYAHGVYIPSHSRPHCLIFGVPEKSACNGRQARIGKYSAALPCR